MDVFVALSLSICFLQILLFLNSIWRQQKMSRFLPPGPAPLPLLGNLNYFSNTAAMKHYPELYKKYGPIFTIWKGTKPNVVLCGYEVVKEALITHGEQFSGRPFLPVTDISLKGYGFVSDNGQIWRQMRRILLTVLRNCGMGKKSGNDLMVEEVDRLLMAVSETGGKAFNPLGVLEGAVSSITCYILFGKRYDYQDQEIHALREVIKEHLTNVLSFPVQFCDTFPIFLHLPFIRNKVIKEISYIQSFVRKQIDLHRQTLDVSSPRDFIDFFLVKIKEEAQADDVHLNDTALHMIATIILAAGIDTTTFTMKYGLVAMAHFPDIQAKVQHEIDTITGSLRLVEMPDRAQMPYTNAVIHEIQRHLDLASLGVDRAVTEDIKFHGFTIPKGTTITPYLSTVMFDPTQWSTPEEFNPGHFLDETGQFQARPAFMPFSAGKRVCPGENLARMSIFIFFCGLLQRFTFCRVSGAQPETGKSLNEHKSLHIFGTELCAVPRSVPSK